jgi:PAS domain S-box-containing protein
MNKTKVAAGGTRKSNSRRRNGTNGARRDAPNRKNGRRPQPASHSRRGNGALKIAGLTKGEQTELALRQSEERYRTLFDLVPVAVYACDADGFIEEYNQRAADLWGCEPGRNGHSPKFCGSYKIFHPDGRPMPHQKCPMARVLRGEKLTPKDLEIVVERPDGERRNVVPSPHVLRDGRGKITGAINCLYDITERKRVETDALRLAAIVQSSHDAIVAKDLNGIITDWNQSAERIFGYKPKEIIGKSILTLIPPDRRDEETEILRRIRRGELIEHYETIRRSKDGKLVDVSLTISPIKDFTGKIIGVSKIARDVTEQKTVDRRFAEQGRLLDLSNEAILVRDRDDQITYWSRGAAELYGYPAEEALGKVTHKLLRTEHSEPLQKIFEKLERENRWRGELVHRHKNGTKIVVMSHWALDRDDLGKRADVLETNTDITALKEAELALQRSKATLEKLVHQRTKALRVANAELENEITRRKGLEGQILEISDREQERLGQELHDGLCQQLTAIGFLARATALRLRDHRVVHTEDLERIAQLINGSVMDARNIARDLHKEEIEAAEFVQALQDMVDRKIWKTPCRLDLKTEVNIDDDNVASQLYRILREALVNANKHARATQIVLEVRRLRNDLVFSVTDNGAGLCEKPKTGHGLGFHIMEYRAKSIGARLEFESRKKGGARVACYLPLPVIK